MAWARLDDNFPEHPKTVHLLDLPDLSVGLAAVGVWTLGLGFVAKQAGKGDRSGFISKRRLSALVGTDATPWAEELVAAGYYEVADGGWVYHDLTDYLPRQRDPAVQAANGRRGGQAKAAKRAAGKPPASDSPGETSSDSLSESAGDSLAKSPQSSSEMASHRSSENVARATGTGTGSSTPPRPQQHSTTSRAAVGEQTALVEGGESPQPRTVNQRAQALARHYSELVPLSKFQAVMGICKTAIGPGGFSDEQVRGGLDKLAAEKRPLTADTLRIAMEGLPAANGHAPYVNPADAAYGDTNVR